ncbi:MAG: hypothetical protein M3O31_06130 [Acidobacteriota bacterium]|nr:hypothetical protein [Acidobacteriota bacterium]
MPIGFTNPGRILLFGNDSMLLDTRALVLQSAHFVVDLANDMETLKERIASTDPTYRAVICCYTTVDTEREEIVALTSRWQITMLQLDCLVQPSVLIAQVSALVAEKS